MVSTWVSEPACTLCGANKTMMLEQHHKVFRSQGGSDAKTNLIWLCKVCHMATHGIKADLNGHNCASCPVRRTYGCYFGERVLGRAIKTAPPWELGAGHAQGEPR